MSQKFFNTYQEAINFRTGSGVSNASKPFSRLVWTNEGVQIPVWAVTLPNVMTLPDTINKPGKFKQNQNSCCTV